MSFEDLKPGDVVFVSTTTGLYSKKVDRVTKTQIVIGDCRYNRKTGCRRGGSAWDVTHLLRPTPELQARQVAQSGRQPCRLLLPPHVDRQPAA